MFRRRVKLAKAKEIEFPIDLEKLGLFINDQDQLRQIENPEEKFKYYTHGKSNGYVYDRKQTAPSREKERMNERRREAVDECLRRIVFQRLENIGMKEARLPLGAAPDEPHVPIFVSEGLEKAKKVLILSPDPSSGNLGIWGIRQMQEDTINFGSMVGTIKLAKEDGYAVVILNPGQIIWDHETKAPMNFLSWKAKDKTSAALDPVKNVIPNNESPEEHVEYVFNNILRPMVPKDAEIDVVACGFAAYSIVKYLNNNWDEWKGRMFAMAFAESSHAINNITSEDFRLFLRLRTRNYVVHNDPRGEYLLDPRFGCATYSSATMFPQAIIPECADLFHEYLRDAHQNPENCNPDVPVILGDVPDTDEWLEQLNNMKAANPAFGWDNSAEIPS
jgi:hypothetical protein